MERFPDVHALALAEEDDVLRMWDGLGYYSRARNLQKAARVVRERHNGSLPDSVGDLRELPGFGAYTAGAVASIAFGVAAPAVDGNVKRVLSRLFDLEAPSTADLQARAARLVDLARPGDFNQALMELGATVCSPRSPRCTECPLSKVCLARARGTVSLRPAPRVKRSVPERSFAVAVVVDAAGERVLLVRRRGEGLLTGLWAFPEAQLDGAGSPLDAALARTEELGLCCRAVGPLPPVRHTFTHLRATYLPWLLRLGERSADPGPHERWVPPAEPDVAVPAAQKRILQALASPRLPGCSSGFAAHAPPGLAGGAARPR
jgi:A/G-specific adenine glycosylase